jgi:uncharacterized protein
VQIIWSDPCSSVFICVHLWQIFGLVAEMHRLDKRPPASALWNRLFRRSTSSDLFAFAGATMAIRKIRASQNEFSLPEARRIALAAQGFDRPRKVGGLVRRGDVSRTIKQIGLLQIDYVNVLLPAHYQVLFSRLGPYDKTLLDELVYRRREFTEQWAHEASIVPIETWPLLHYRRATHRVRPYDFELFLEAQPEYAHWVLEQVRTRGPLVAGDVPDWEGIVRRIEGAWVSIPRAVLESYFGRGILAVADRRPDFGRVFDLAERIIPVEHHGKEVESEEAQRELLLIAARAHGIATADDLADYFRMKLREARPRLNELVESGKLREVRVQSWRQTAYLHPEAVLPSRVDAASLLSPFDPVVWFRARAARLFEFEYRVEIFVPQPKRRWGYYVLPFLLGERLVARVDLKADRPGRRLVVMAAHVEPDALSGPTAEALAAELKTMAAWLGLESVAVERRGDFAKPLATAIRSAKS